MDHRLYCALVVVTFNYFAPLASPWIVVTGHGLIIFSFYKIKYIYYISKSDSLDNLRAYTTPYTCELWSLKINKK
jgi:hypothetical protein